MTYKPGDRVLVKEYHGHASNGIASPEYRSWQSMKERCLRTSYRAYNRYGGRGIIICERWKCSFTNFLEDMGLKPTPKHTLERIDNDGNYEPSNCRWATMKEQRANQALRIRKTSSHLSISYDKETKSWRVLPRANLGRFATEEEAKRALDAFSEMLRTFIVNWTDGATWRIEHTNGKNPVITEVKE